MRKRREGQGTRGERARGENSAEEALATTTFLTG